MASSAESPRVSPGGLVTVAYLKARLDEGVDHLDIFAPLILDAVATFPGVSFTTADMQQALAATHGIAMPQQTVATLLKRAASRKLIARDAGRFVRKTSTPLPGANLLDAKSLIEDAQEGLANALLAHAIRRGLKIPSPQAALALLLSFLEDQQVAILLGTPSATDSEPGPSVKERLVVAEFIQSVVANDPAHSAVLRSMLEGLVLYHAAFLPDLQAATRHFTGLKVVFDSNLVRQALGYEGPAQSALLRDTIELLIASGAQCVAFDISLTEITRILSMYEGRLATAQGRESLRHDPMAREFLTKRYTPSDIRQMTALLKDDVQKAGFVVQAVPLRLRDHTAGERALTLRLANPATKDELEPRVVHDVDCVAGILTLRKGRRSNTVEDCEAVFAASNPAVIQTVRKWWTEDEQETSLPPVVHIRALATLAWLKKPSLSADLKMHELVALCAAALRPSAETWKRFLRHLDQLQSSKRITSNEAAAIVVSALSEPLLREAELSADSPRDIDSLTLDDVVARVKESYSQEARDSIETAKASFDEQTQRLQSEASNQLADVRKDYEERLRELADKAAQSDATTASLTQTIAENRRRRELLVTSMARSKAKNLFLGIYVTIGVCACGVGFLLAFLAPIARPLAIMLGLLIVGTAVLELIGVLPHLSRWRDGAEVRMTTYFREGMSDSLSL